MNMEDDNTWRSPSFRQLVVHKINESIANGELNPRKSTSDIENLVFSKARNKDEYFSYVARLIIHVREKSATLRSQNAVNSSTFNNQNSQSSANDVLVNATTSANFPNIVYAPQIVPQRSSNAQSFYQPLPNTHQNHSFQPQHLNASSQNESLDCRAEQLWEQRTVASKIQSTSSETSPDSSDNNNCKICYEKQIDSVFYKCGHMCMCIDCAVKAHWKDYKWCGSCPICRAPVQDVIRTFKS